MEGNASTAWPTSIESPGGGHYGIPLRAREVARPTAPPRRPPRDGEGPDTDAQRFAVRVMDNPVNTYEEVIVVCAQVLGISLEEGFRIAETVDHEGSCVVGSWPRAEAERIAAGIAVIGIDVRIEPETGA